MKHCLKGGLMPRNRTYHRRYLIEFKGVSSNYFMPGFLDKMFKDVVETLLRQFAQLKVVKFEITDPAEVEDAANVK